MSNLETKEVKTPTDVRRFLAQSFEADPASFESFTSKLLLSANKTNQQYLKQVFTLLKSDLLEIFKYRNQTSETIGLKSFKRWFPYITNDEDCNSILEWINTDRDFIYNSHGLKLLKNRYLRPSEPIQYCMLRIAKLFAGKKNEAVDFQVWRVMYDALSCGFMHVSSVLADADHADAAILPGEACRLLVSDPNYDRRLVNQINEICNIVSLGVGVGMSATTIPLIGSNINGNIRSGFRSFARRMDSCNLMSIYERKPKVAIYIEMHNDTIYEAFELRTPHNVHLENVFPGIMISDYFMECLDENKDWYLFSGQARLNGKTLCEFSGEEYKKMYKQFVDAKLYSKVVSSSELMDALVTSISETGSPYVVWSDNVNRFSNHKHLGKIKTLNLCAEIANFASVDVSSSCTLMSINYATYKDFPEALSSIYKFVKNMSTFENYCGLESCEQEFEYPEMSKYAYSLGFIGTLALNNFMGVDRKYRELGISPLGVYDMALIGSVDPIKMISFVSEAMYKGCIHASCKFSSVHNVQCEYYKGSPYSEGITQWSMRNEPTSTNWAETSKLMKGGMANSQLTAQAPTATTSMLVGVTESVTFPMSILMARESENGRNDLICYGVFCKLINEPNINIDLNNHLDRQIIMYKKSAPFVDQSQSTMFALSPTRQNIYELILETYDARLKTSIYYILPKQLNTSLTIVREDRGYKRASSTSDAPETKRSRRPSCDACSG